MASLAGLSVTAVLLALLGNSEAGEYCWTDYGQLEYCTFDCCTNECCALTGWLIAVIVIGCILFISVVIAIICCVVKSQGAAGRVVQPTTTVMAPAYGHVTMVSSGQPVAWGQPGAQGYSHGPNAPPPGYGSPPDQGYSYGPNPPPPPIYQPAAYPFAAAAATTSSDPK